MLLILSTFTRKLLNRYFVIFKIFLIFVLLFVEVFVLY